LEQGAVTWKGQLLENLVGVSGARALCDTLEKYTQDYLFLGIRLAALVDMDRPGRITVSVYHERFVDAGGFRWIAPPVQTIGCFQQVGRRGRFTIRRSLSVVVKNATENYASIGYYAMNLSDEELDCTLSCSVKTEQGATLLFSGSLLRYFLAQSKEAWDAGRSAYTIRRRSAKTTKPRHQRVRRRLLKTTTIKRPRGRVPVRRIFPSQRGEIAV